MNITDMYSVGDFVVSTCVNCNGAVIPGDIGRVAMTEGQGKYGMILIDWQVEPDGKRMHRGNRLDFELKDPTGWWIFDTNKKDVAPFDDRIDHKPTEADLEALFA